MKRLGHLFEQVVSFENIYLASMKAFRGKKGKRQAARFYFELEKEILWLEEGLRNGSYQPAPYGVFRIFEPKERQICCSAFRDRVVHHAICNVIEPVLEKRFIFDTYACRKEKGTHLAMRRAQYFTRCVVWGGYYLKCDIKKYFHSVDHKTLKKILGRIFKDKRLLNLLEKIIDHKVPGDSLGKGLPIGNLTSQYFANLYLGELDHFLKERLNVKFYLRYMDDFLLFSHEKAQLSSHLKSIRYFLETRLGLELKERVTRLAPVSEGVPFLGFRIFPALIRLQRENLVRTKRKIRKKEKEYVNGEITIEEMSLSVSSLVAHISHADSTRLRQRVFEKSFRYG